MPSSDYFDIGKYQKECIAAQTLREVIRQARMSRMAGLLVRIDRLSAIEDKRLLAREMKAIVQSIENENRGAHEINQ